MLSVGGNDRVNAVRDFSLLSLRSKTADGYGLAKILVRLNQPARHASGLAANCPYL